MRGAVAAFAALSESEPPEITGQTLEQDENAESFRQLVRIGALTEGGRSDTVLCFACDVPHAVSVDYAGGGHYRSYCADVGYQDVPAAWLQKFVVSEEWFAGVVRASLRVTPSPPAIPGPLLRVGAARIGRTDCQLFFVRRIDEKVRLREVLDAIDSAVGSSPVVLLTTTPRNLVAGDIPAGRVVVNVESILIERDGRIAFDDTSVIAAIRGTAPPSASGIATVFSLGFRSAAHNGAEYTFTKKQAEVIEALHGAIAYGTGRLHQEEIKGSANSNQRVGQIFRDHPAYGTLIKYDGDGYYWLDP